MSNKQATGLTPVEKIQANAEFVIRTMRESLGVELGYDAKSVQWVDGYIERQRNTGNPALVEQLVSVLGSFVGECIRHEFGGEWTLVDGSWGIMFRPNNIAYPINKVAKQFKDGVENGESVYGFYTAIAPVFFNRPQSSNPDSVDSANSEDSGNE